MGTDAEALVRRARPRRFRAPLLPGSHSTGLPSPPAGLALHGRGPGLLGRVGLLFSLWHAWVQGSPGGRRRRLADAARAGVRGSFRVFSVLRQARNDRRERRRQGSERLSERPEGAEIRAESPARRGRPERRRGRTSDRRQDRKMVRPGETLSQRTAPKAALPAATGEYRRPVSGSILDAARRVGGGTARPGGACRIAGTGRGGSAALGRNGRFAFREGYWRGQEGQHL